MERVEHSGMGGLRVGSSLGPILYHPRHSMMAVHEGGLDTRIAMGQDELNHDEDVVLAPAIAERCK